jgi:lambda repressor-like predicted transcriptional regulator
MSTNTIDFNALQMDLQRFAPLFQAYLECSDELQIHAQKLFKILSDPATDADDRALAAMTLADVLFPNFHEGELGSDLEECEAMAMHTPESREALARMDEEEAVFADRLRAVMKEGGVSQVQLAERLGVGQSAIAMMLQRQCRPQRRTITRMAEALGVQPESLWPSSSVR